MSAAGEPVKGRHAVCLWSAQSAQGTAVTPATAAGIVDFEDDVNADIRQLFGIGSPNALFNKPGINSSPFKVGIIAVQTTALLLKAVRSSGALPWLTLGF